MISKSAVLWQPCADWPVIQIKHGFDISLGKMLQPNPIGAEDTEAPYIKAVNVQWDGVVTEDLPTMWASANDLENLNLRFGDLLVCEGGEVGRASTLDKEPPNHCIYQNALHRVRSAENDVRYLKYCLKLASETGWFDVVCNRATIAHFTVEKFREFRIHIPHLALQQSIADYLDYETARLDAMAKEKLRMLNLLEEKRAVEISRLVTRGLNLNVKLKPSEAPWFDAAPTTWSIERLKWSISTVSSGVSVNSSDQPIQGEGFGILKTSAVSGGRFFPGENKAVWDSEYERLACPVTAGSIIMSRMNTPALVGESSYVDRDYPNLFLPDRLWKINFVEERVFGPFMALLLSSKKARHALSAMATGTSPSMKNLSIEEMKNILVPIPPLPEQKAIYESVALRDSYLEPVKRELSNSLRLIGERRSALISATLTGKFLVEEMAT